MAEKKDREAAEEKPAKSKESKEAEDSKAPDKSDKSNGSEEAEESEGTLPVTGLEGDLESYPLRNPEEDPRWAVRIVCTWVGIALASLAFTVVLIVLGFFYD